MAIKDETATEKSTVKAEEPKFYIHELREHSQEIFSVKPEILDGALFDYKDIKITKNEAKKRIESFLKKEVK
ncbi:hypothetical protein [Metabacillus fastidiosus]|uniref:hypothetical protein n=1 Tax=Metabacillus fastidiosus TaxID=1458 RepID=UPI003D26B3D2